MLFTFWEMKNMNDNCITAIIASVYMPFTKCQGTRLRRDISKIELKRKIKQSSWYKKQKYQMS